MSSSSGAGATAVEMSQILPRHIFRYLLLHKDPMKTLDFSPEGDTLPLLFDSYDNAQKHYYMDESDEKRLKDTARAYELTYPAGETLPSLMQLPRFSQIVFLCQMPHLDLLAQVEELKGTPLTEAEKAELAVRVEYAQKWLATYAPEQYRFHLGDYTGKYPLDEVEKQAVRQVAEYLAANPEATGAKIHEKIHAVKEELGLEPKKLFQAFYRILLDRESGPQLGFMLGALPRAETVVILQKAVN
jgi:lysyl-tRNA synthetase class 1